MPLAALVSHGRPLPASDAIHTCGPDVAERLNERYDPSDSDTLFFGADHEPKLPHEYQFDLGTAEGRTALARSLAFLAGAARSAPRNGC